MENPIPSEPDVAELELKMKKKKAKSYRYVGTKQPLTLIEAAQAALPDEIENTDTNLVRSAFYVMSKNTKEKNRTILLGKQKD